MTVLREWVSSESPTMPRAGHGSRPCQGLYHRPDGEWPTTAMIATHYNVDFAEHYLAEHVAALGVGFLGWNTRYRGNEAYFQLEQAVTDIGVGVQWLREHGVDRVVILGNSGGGSLMGAYQAQTGEADAYIALNAHPGRPEVLTAWLDPSVTDETDPLSRDPELDMFEPANGPPYEPAFVERYRAAQVERNNRVTAWARRELERLQAGGAYDTVFPLHRNWADLRFLDLAIDPSHRDVGCYAGDPKWANYSPLGLGKANTCRAWLSMWSLEESSCRGAEHLAEITVPALVMQSLGDKGVYPSDAQAIFDALGTASKRLDLVPGAHYFEDGGEPRRAEVAAQLVDWLDG